MRKKTAKALYGSVIESGSGKLVYNLNESGETDEQWRKFQREWLRPEIVTKKFGEVWNHIDD